MNQPKTLIDLVQHYSPSGQERAAVDYLVGRMAELGFERAWRDEVGNAVGVTGEGARQIVLLGHIDTVPGEIPVRVTDGILHGRGSVDAKGPLAAFVDAVAAVGPVEGWQFVVIGAVDEERESLGARHVVNQYGPDYVIVGEPSGWERITLGYKGSARAQVTVRREMAHTAAQDESAPEAAVEIWNRVQAWAAAFNAGRERAFTQALPTLQGFSSETDGFKETATLQIGVRLPEDLDPLQWYAHLRELASAAGGEVQPKGYPIPAYRAERNTPLVRAFLGGIRAAGGKPGFVVKTGTADLNIVAPAWGCPAVVYGPGDSSLDHTPNEHLSLDDYNHSVQVLTAALQRLTSHRNS
ncbi:MAG: [LysW]-lysine hydrolase [Chloroflexi bacterium]|nr:[LysW]-lysine hydrolase [Chloroflexota bacterium]